MGANTALVGDRLRGICSVRSGIGMEGDGGADGEEREERRLRRTMPEGMAQEDEGGQEQEFDVL